MASNLSNEDKARLYVQCLTAASTYVSGSLPIMLAQANGKEQKFVFEKTISGVIPAVALMWLKDALDIADGALEDKKVDLAEMLTT